MRENTEVSSFTNRERAQQLIDFKGLQFGKCSPTDIDMSMDWQGRTFIFVEVKGLGKPITLGQKYHLEGLCKGLTRGGKTAYGIVVHHETRADEDITAHECMVDIVYNGYGWEKGEQNQTLGGLLEELYENHMLENG